MKGSGCYICGCYSTPPRYGRWTCVDCRDVVKRIREIHKAKIVRGYEPEDSPIFDRRTHANEG